MDELKERRDAPLVPNNSAESFNAKDDVRCYPKSIRHWGSGCYSRKRACMSGNVFVFGIDGKPLTPTTNARARKLLEGEQAIPLWNKFGQFGIQLLVRTRKEHPKTVLGLDFGTKFEGYSVVTNKINNLSVMWKLPDKKPIVDKLEERKNLRRARRHRNCRRREARFDNRNKDGFIAPSQLLIIRSRLKAIKELFKCYPIDEVALEDVCFNHRDKRWGANFSTIEIGKNMIMNWLSERAKVWLYTGINTQSLRKEYGYRKLSNKSNEVFDTHCSDSLTLALDNTVKKHILKGKFIVIDDKYRSIRRRLHDTQFSKGGIRYPYSNGNFKGVRKSTICNHGQIVGGTKTNYWIRNIDNKRIGRVEIEWLSHKFKIIKEKEAMIE